MEISGTKYAMQPSGAGHKLLHILANSTTLFPFELQKPVWLLHDTFSKTKTEMKPKQTKELIGTNPRA